MRWVTDATCTSANWESGAGYETGCRCPRCMKAHSRRIRGRVRRRREEWLSMDLDGRMVCVHPDVKHGEQATYSNWTCRCVPCTTANTEACRARYRARKAKITG